MNDQQRKAVFAKLNTRSRNLKVYDNGGKSFDRYTVVIDDQAYAMSGNPFSPQGFNQFAGDVAPNQVQVGSHLGKRVLPSSLNDDVQKAIIDRMSDDFRKKLMGKIQ